MMADDIIEGYELDLPHSEHKIHVKKLPYGNYVVIETGGLTIKVRGGAAADGKWPEVEVTGPPGQELSIWANAGFAAEHPAGESDYVMVTVRKKGKKHG